MAQVITSLLIGSFLVAELTSVRGSTQYWVTFVFTFGLASILLKLVSKRIFASIDRSKTALERQHGDHVELSLCEAIAKAESLLKLSRMKTEPRRMTREETVVLEELGPSFREFFHKHGYLRDLDGEMEVTLESPYRVEVTGLGGGIQVGGEGMNCLLVARPGTEEVIEVFEPNTQAQELEVYPTVYHYLAEYYSRFTSSEGNCEKTTGK